jgi:aminopeptidase N
MRSGLAAAWLCIWLARADSYPRQPGVDVQHYVFRITLSDASDEIAGETSVSVRFAADALTKLVLDLAAPSRGRGMTVTGVASDGSPAAYTHNGERLEIALTPPTRTGETRTLTIRYHGIPAGGLHALRNKFGERTFFSTNWPDQAHQWLPTIDHPNDKATSEFIVTAPSRYEVVSNGALVDRIDGGDDRTTTHWKESVPIATWLDDIAVADFAYRRYGALGGVPLETWLFPQDRDAGRIAFEEPMRQALEFYTSRIGPYPYEKLAAVEAAGMSGGMEHASAVFFGEKSFSDRPALGLAAHEIAHQWFGDSVTEKDWDDVWLSEGFATYFALLTAEHVEGRDAFAAGLAHARAAVFAAEKNSPDVAVVQNRPWRGIPHPIVYQKGAWVLHMLRGLTGTEKFWNGTREYYRRFRDGNASTADLETVMEETTGVDLGWFFQQWLYRAGSPVLEGGWHYDAGKIRVELTQTQPGAAFRLPLQIGFGDGKRSLAVVNVEMAEKRQTFEIPAERQPESVELDPGIWLLAEIHFRASGRH